jgi:putative ABC transport system permease protein
MAGLALAFAVTRTAVVFYPEFPFDPPGWAIAAALAVSTAVGLVFGALPARRAARLDPVAALSRR